MQKKKTENGKQTSEIPFIFIKCRNFYVFLINAMLRQLRGRICYDFNEKKERTSVEGAERKQLKTKFAEGGNYE